MNLFENLTDLYAENLAVISDNNECISYTKLDEISNYLKDRLPQRSLIFSLNKNSLGSFCGYFSFLRNKVVPLMLETKIDFKLLESLISLYEPAYLWLPSEDTAKFSGGKVICSVFDYSLLKLQYKITFKLNDDLALLLTTSGSTGSPKLVKLSYENIKSNAFSIIEYLSIDHKERPITTLPMSYSFGLSIINSHIYAGATLLLTNRSLMEKQFWVFMKENKATSLSGVPYTFEMLKRLRFSRMDLPYLKTLTQAGGKLRNELIQEFTEICKEKDKEFVVMYGQTEATARMSYLPIEEGLKKLGSIGIAIPGGEFRLVDDNKTIIEGSETVGELVYKGANVSMGYALCKEDLARPDENKGVLFTGDLAKRDDEGFYYIVGRKKRFIKIFGNRINLDATEQILKTKIEECACVGADDKMKIYITKEDMIAEVKEFISLKTGIHANAFSVNYINEIPKNAAGKTIYSKLQVSNVSR